MARPRKLGNIEEVILTTRVFIARTTRIITRKEIAHGFDMDVSTLHRYSSEPYREYSRSLSPAQYERSKRDQTMCHFCKCPTDTHPKCAGCAILLHNVATDRHGGTPDMKRCNSCVRSLTKYGSTNYLH
jgi:hypothetical protein